MTVQVGKDCVDREEAARMSKKIQKPQYKGRTVSRMNNNTDELAKLRGRFSELKTTLEERIKENHESLIRIANLNYHIDRLLERSKRHFTTPALKTISSQ